MLSKFRVCNLWNYASVKAHSGELFVALQVIVGCDAKDHIPLVCGTQFELLLIGYLVRLVKIDSFLRSCLTDCALLCMCVETAS